MARKSKLTPKVQSAICAAVEAGATYELAAKAAGVTYETLRVWRESKAAFSVALDEAEGRAAQRWLRVIERAAVEDGSWHAAAWKLERRYPESYGRQVQRHEVAGDVRIVVDYVNDWRGKAAVASKDADGDDTDPQE